MKSACARILASMAILSFCLTCPALGLDENLLGLYYDLDASIHEIDIAPNSTQMLYLVLLNPVNEDYDGGQTRDVERVAGFECAVEHPTGDVVLDVTFPTPAVNLGSAESVVAGFGTAVPVTSQHAAMLATFTVLTMGNSPVGYRLVPTAPSSRPNAMAYVDSDDPDDRLVEMMPVSGAFDRPVFTFGDYTIEQNAKWGEVKSLYR